MGHEVDRYRLPKWQNGEERTKKREQRVDGRWVIPPPTTAIPILEFPFTRKEERVLSGERRVIHPHQEESGGWKWKNGMEDEG